MNNNETASVHLIRLAGGLFVGILAVSSCAGPTADSTDTGPVTSSPSSAVTTPATTMDTPTKEIMSMSDSPVLRTFLEGMAVLASDIQGQPDVAIGKGSVIVVPQATAAAFWESVGFPPEGPESPVLEFDVDPTVLPPGAEVVSIAPDGSFTADVTGSALICLTDIFPDDDTSPPLRVRGGCADKPTDLVSITVAFQRMTFIRPR